MIKQNNSTLNPEICQHYLNTGCTIKELSEKFGISESLADRHINGAIQVIKNQIRMEKMIISGQDLEAELSIIT